MHKSKYKQLISGIALISVMWVLLLISIMAMSMLSSVKTHSQLAENKLIFTQMESIAEGAIYKALQTLNQPLDANKSSLSEDQYTMEILDHSVDIILENESDKIDINTADIALITALLAYHDIDEKSAWEIGEKIQILRSESKQKPFKNNQEFMQLSSKIKDRFDCINPYITVYSGKSTISASTKNPMQNLLQWADKNSWGGKSWPAIKNSRIKGSVLRQSKSLSGQAYTIKARINYLENFQISKLTTIRLTGSKSQPFWVLNWQSFYQNNQNCATK